MLENVAAMRRAKSKYNKEISQERKPSMNKDHLMKSQSLSNEGLKLPSPKSLNEKNKDRPSSRVNDSQYKVLSEMDISSQNMQSDQKTIKTKDLSNEKRRFFDLQTEQSKDY